MCQHSLGAQQQCSTLFSGHNCQLSGQWWSQDNNVQCLWSDFWPSVALVASSHNHVVNLSLSCEELCKLNTTGNHPKFMVEKSWGLKFTDFYGTFQIQKKWFLENSTIPEFIQKKTVQFTTILKTYFPGSSKLFTIKVHDEMRKKKVNFKQIMGIRPSLRGGNKPKPSILNTNKSMFCF